MGLETPASYTHMWLRDNSTHWTLSVCVCRITEMMVFLPQEKSYTQDLTTDSLFFCASVTSSTLASASVALVSHGL